MNTGMSELLNEAKIKTPFSGLEPSDKLKLTMPNLIALNDSVLMRDQYESSSHLKPSEFQDLTGYECLLNHVHLPYDGSRESLISCLCYATALQERLSGFEQGRQFLVIVTFSADGCVVRFHQRRPNETWLTDDLEGYREEAVLVLCTDDREAQTRCAKTTLDG